MNLSSIYFKIFCVTLFFYFMSSSCSLITLNTVLSLRHWMLHWFSLLWSIFKLIFNLYCSFCFCFCCLFFICLRSRSSSIYFSTFASLICATSFFMLKAYLSRSSILPFLLSMRVTISSAIYWVLMTLLQWNYVSSFNSSILAALYMFFS